MSGGIPDGHVEVEITIDENGEFKQEIIGHGGTTSCQNIDDKKLLEDLLGELGEEEDYGKTCEYYDETKVKVVQKPHTSTPFKDTPEAQTEKKKLDLGFGV